ncbi:MAG: hypothetical protein GYB64_00540 [Chloroflexi bacterium]|nr:hypothetical protein [Chloroflexota bacterium]
MSEDHSNKNWLQRNILTRQNLWALILAVMIILIFACATAGVQPEFIYQGF